MSVSRLKITTTRFEISGLLVDVLLSQQYPSVSVSWSAYPEPHAIGGERFVLPYSAGRENIRSPQKWQVYQSAGDLSFSYRKDLWPLGKRHRDHTDAQREIGQLPYGRRHHAPFGDEYTRIKLLRQIKMRSCGGVAPCLGNGFFVSYRSLQVQKLRLYS